jgi:hypothetical protein
MPDRFSSPPPPWGPQPFDDRDLDALLAGNIADVPVTLRPVADVLAALQAAPSPAELRGEATIRAEFRALAESRALGLNEPATARASRATPPTVANETTPTRELPALPGPERAGRRRRRRGAKPGRLAGSRLGALLAAAAIVVIAVAVTYSGNLPGPVQRLAHITLAGPSVTHSGGAVASPGMDARSSSVASDRSQSAEPDSGSPAPQVSPSASAAPDKKALCGALLTDLEHPVPGQAKWWQTPEFKQLSIMAGGPGRVSGYCGKVWAEQDPHDYPQPRADPPYLPRQGSGSPGGAEPGSLGNTGDANGNENNGNGNGGSGSGTGAGNSAGLNRP